SLPAALPICSGDRAVPNDRAEPRVFAELRLVGIAEALVFARFDRIPRIARDPPADGGFLLQRIEVLGFAAQQVEYGPTLEQSAHLAFTYEPRKVGAAQRREDRVRLRVDARLYDRT